MNEKHFIGPEAIIEKKKKYIMPCLAHFYSNPQEMVKGSMQYLWDSNGKKYLDCYAGVSVMNCGHCNPEITELEINPVLVGLKGKGCWAVDCLCNLKH